MKKILWFCCLLPLLGGCAMFGNKDVPLTGTVWVLEEDTLAERCLLREPERDVTLVLLPEHQAVGCGGVNRYFCRYSSSPDGKIAFGPVSATKMAGPAMKYEEVYFAMLGKADSWHIADGHLTLSGKGGALARFEPDDDGIDGNDED